MRAAEEQPDDSEPTPERQAQLAAACERNLQRLGAVRDRVVAIRTRGELHWLMRQQGWSGEVGDRRTSRVLLTGASFVRANLREVHLYLAGLMDSSFLEADLRGAVLIGADLLDTSFSGANLEGAQLVGAYLSHANLRGANLRGASLVHANLRYAGLRGADLNGADLFGADLTHADLSGANLRGADVRTRHFDEQTKLNGILVDDATRLTYGMRQQGDNAEAE